MVDDGGRAESVVEMRGAVKGAGAAIETVFFSFWCYWGGGVDGVCIVGFLRFSLLCIIARTSICVCV